MKKILLVLMFILVLPFAIVRAETETIDYNLTFIDNSQWNLTTGALQTNSNWISTNRLTIYSDEINLTGSQVHHVLFWDKNNTYMGYYNIDTTYENSRFLGNSTMDVSPPTGAKKFAVTSNKLGINSIVQALPDYTYDQVFGSPTYLDYTDSILTDTLGTVFTNPTYLDYTDDTLTDTLGTVFTSGTYLNYTDNVLNDSLGDIFGNPTYISYVYSPLNQSLTSIIAGNTTTATQLVSNGDFSNGTTGWTPINIGTPTVTNGIYTFTATAQFGRTQVTTNTLSLYGSQNDKMYVVSKLKSTVTANNQVSFSVNDGVSETNIFYTTAMSGAFTLLSGIRTISSTATLFSPRIYDNRTSGWTQIDVDYIYAFNISTLISNKQYSPLYSTTFDLMSDAQIKAQMDAWHSSGYLFNNKVFNDHYFKNYLTPTIPTASGWTSTYNVDCDCTVFYYDLPSQSYSFSGTGAPNILNFNSNYTIEPYSDISFSDGFFYQGRSLIYKADGVTDLTALYADFAFKGAINIKVALATPLTTNQANYFWQLYKDAINEVDRYEWYEYGGVTAENFAYYKTLYIDADGEFMRYEFFTDFGITETNWIYYIELYLDALVETARWEWYKDYGIASSNYLYYDELYVDALLFQTVRWEWFRDYGVNASNFADLYGRYQQMLSYGTGIPANEFLLLEASYDREVPIPEESKTWLELIEDLGIFATTLLSIVLMVVIAIVLGLLKAPMVILLLVEGAMFTMFAVFGWFPLWIVVLFVIGLFGMLILLMKGSGGSNGD
jgi:hypothetical protein